MGSLNPLLVTPCHPPDNFAPASSVHQPHPSFVEVSGEASSVVAALSPATGCCIRFSELALPGPGP